MSMGSNRQLEATSGLSNLSLSRCPVRPFLDFDTGRCPQRRDGRQFKRHTALCYEGAVVEAALQKARLESDRREAVDFAASPRLSIIGHKKPKAARKIWRPLFLRNVPGEERLPARVRSGTLRRAWGFSAHNVRHKANVNAAILGAAVSGAVIGSVFIFAHSDQVNLVSRNALGREILHHGISAFLAQLVVVFCRTHGVSVAFDNNKVTLGVGDFSQKLVKSGFGFGGQISLVEGEMN